MPADQPDDLDETFARIVADYDHSTAGRTDAVPWPAQEEVDDTTPATPQPPPPPDAPRETPLRRSETDPLNTAATWADEGHFVPPIPPPLPRPEPLTLLAWLGVLGAPIGFVLSILTGWPLPRLVTGALIIGFVGGILILIAKMSRDGDGHDPDDGAVV